MNKKGEYGQIGTLIMLAVVLIVGLVIVTDGISEPVGLMTTTTSLVNVTYTSAATGSSISLPYQALKGTITLVNQTSGTAIPSTNYTVTNYVVENGGLVTTITSKAGGGGWQGKGVNISATIVEPFGYDTNSGGRTITGLVIIFAALALAVTAMSVVIKNGGFDLN